MVIITKIDGPVLSEKEIAEEFNNLEQTIPTSSEFISKKTNFKIDGQQAALLEYEIVRPTSVDITITAFFSTYSLIYKDILVQIQCSVSGDADVQNIKAIYDSYKPVFFLISNNFVLQSKWLNN